MAHDLITQQEAHRLDEIIVSSATNFKEALLAMYKVNGWQALGFSSWGDYLNNVGERAGYSPQTLRRWANAALLTDAAGTPIGAFTEGALRYITEGLSNSKGFNEGDRVEALIRAIEYAGNLDGVTERHTRSAANYKLVENSAHMILRDNMLGGRVSPDEAAHIMRLIEADNDDSIGPILEHVTDARLADLLHDLEQANGEVWFDVADTILLTGYVPSGHGQQVSLPVARHGDLMNYLYERESFARQLETSRPNLRAERYKLAMSVAYNALNALVQALWDTDAKNMPEFTQALAALAEIDNIK